MKKEDTNPAAKLAKWESEWAYLRSECLEFVAQPDGIVGVEILDLLHERVCREGRNP